MKSNQRIECEQISTFIDSKSNSIKPVFHYLEFLKKMCISNVIIFRVILFQNDTKYCLFSAATNDCIHSNSSANVLTLKTLKTETIRSGIRSIVFLIVKGFRLIGAPHVLSRIILLLFIQNTLSIHKSIQMYWCEDKIDHRSIKVYLVFPKI